MKSILTNIASAILALLLICGIVSYDKKRSEPGDVVPIGTVIYSIIPPTQFLQANKGWVKLDGSPIDQNSELFSIIKETGILSHLNGKIPNASGMFLRNMNYSADGADPDKSRNVGAVQNDAFKKHTHSINIDTYTDSRDLPFDDSYTQVDYQSWYREKDTPHDHPGEGLTPVRFDWCNITNVSYPSVHRDLGHSHRLKWSGYSDDASSSYGVGVETRPQNIALYVYVKIN